MCNDPAFIAAVKETSKEFGTKLIFSYHNFNDTPDEAVIHDKLAKAQQMGADIAKLAVMPKDYADVLNPPPNGTGLAHRRSRHAGKDQALVCP